MVHYSEVRYSNLNSEQNSTEAAAGSVQGQPRGVYRRYLKRMLDILIVILAAPFVLPVVLVLAALASRDGAPAFYVQDRVGLDGRSFRFWKLRSMVPDADRRLADYLAENPAARLEWDDTQKLKNDPRITAIGGFMRKTSLDELPQLWNVLKGDMSIVGPRPMMPQQRGLYPGPVYHRVRPGLTGFWQISDRNMTSFASRSNHDARYAERVSFPTDVIVILMTVRSVLRGTGY